MCWWHCVDVLMCWCVDVLMCWCVDVLMCWCVDVLMCWCSCVDVWLCRCMCWCVEYVDALMIVLMCWCFRFILWILKLTIRCRAATLQRFGICWRFMVDCRRRVNVLISVYSLCLPGLLFFNSSQRNGKFHADILILVLLCRPWDYYCCEAEVTFHCCGSVLCFVGDYLVFRDRLCDLIIWMIDWSFVSLRSSAF